MREIADSKKLFQTVSALHPGDLLADIYHALTRRIAELGGLPPALDEEMMVLSQHLLACEDAIFKLDEPEWEALSMQDAVDWRTMLRAKEHFLRNLDRCSSVLIDVVAGTLVGLADEFPQPSAKALFRVPRCHLLDDCHEVVARIVDTYLTTELDDHGMLYELRRQLYLNLCHASGFVPDQEHKKPFINPSDKGLPPHETVSLYLGNTPFEPLLLRPVDVPIPMDTLFSHMHVVGGSGAGKTSWLGQLALHLMEDADHPSLVVVDSQSSLIPPLSTLTSIQHRLLYIDPRDPPAINVFDGEGAIEMMDYLFESIVGAKLTPKQSVFFNFIAELMIATPGATMLDVLRVMRDPAPYADHIEALPDLARDFFVHDFNNSNFRETKEQVRYRLNALMRNPALNKILTSPTTDIDIGSALDTGTIVLIDTSKEFLKGVSAQFGRVFIALILRALHARFAVPEARRHPTFLLIDEAHEYFDQNIDELLTQVRKLKCGCVFAHQYLGQCTPQLRESLAANTAIRMAAGVSVADARTLAPALRTSADFILAQPPLSFATYVRNVTNEAIPITVTPGLVGQRTHVSVRHKMPTAPRRVTKAPSAEAPPQTSSDDIDTDASDSW